MIGLFVIVPLVGVFILLPLQEDKQLATDLESAGVVNPAGDITDVNESFDLTELICVENQISKSLCTIDTFEPINPNTHSVSSAIKNLDTLESVPIEIFGIVALRSVTTTPLFCVSTITIEPLNIIDDDFARICREPNIPDSQTFTQQNGVEKTCGEYREQIAKITHGDPPPPVPTPIPEYTTFIGKYAFRELRPLPCSGEGSNTICPQGFQVFDLVVGQVEEVRFGRPSIEGEPDFALRPVPYHYEPTAFELGERVTLSGKLFKTLQSPKVCGGEFLPSAIFIVSQEQWGDPPPILGNIDNTPILSFFGG